MSGTSVSNPPDTPPGTHPIPRTLMVMPRPGQPGSMQFDGTNVTEFLDDWDVECEDYGFSDAKKCTRLPNYCIPAIKDLVKLLPGYLASDWGTLQTNLKDIYWQHDKPKNTHEALIKLVKEASSMDLNVYLMKFTAITDSLISKHALSDLDRIGRLLDGLQPALRTRVLKFCAKNSWRLSSNDTGTSEPNFAQLKDFILTEAKAAQKETVYNTERSIREGTELQSSSTTTVTTPTATVTTSPPASNTSAPSTAPSVTSVPSPYPAADSMAELTKKFSELALVIEANLKGPATAPPVTNSANPRPPMTLRCIWCDSTEHMRRSCSELTVALKNGLVRFNNEFRLINASTGQELPTMYGRGGMKKFFEGSPAIISVTNNAITLEPTTYIGNQSSVRLTTLDIDGNVQTDEIVDADVFEKRRRDEILRPRVRPRADDVRPAPRDISEDTPTVDSWSILMDPNAFPILSTKQIQQILDPNACTSSKEIQTCLWSL